MLAVIAAGLVPAGAAQAQWYSSVPRQPAPLYPYAVPTDRPYAVEVAPGTYVIQRPAAARPAPVTRQRPSDDTPPASERRRTKADPALIEELRQRSKGNVVNTTKIVRKKPIVIETKRYVDDPPRVIERYHVADDKPAKAQPKNKRAAVEDGVAATPKRKNAGKNHGSEKRVIEADAEITILGPDRMSIRLFRKGGKARASASADE